METQFGKPSDAKSKLKWLISWLNNNLAWDQGLAKPPGLLSSSLAPNPLPPSSLASLPSSLSQTGAFLIDEDLKTQQGIEEKIPTNARKFGEKRPVIVEQISKPPTTDGLRF